MSVETAHLTFALAREEAADPCFDEKLAEAAIRMLAGGDVGFKLSTRVGATLMPRWKLAVYSLLCRRLPASLRVPPAPAMQRGFYYDWHTAVDACQAPDDQLLVMTVGRAKSADSWDLPVECRPKDETDKRRYLTLQSVFGAWMPVTVCTPERRAHLIGMLESLPALDSRLRALEARVNALEREGADASEIT